MAQKQSEKWLKELAGELERREKRRHAAEVVAGLAGGLSLLRECLYLRVHQDVEERVGRDSMMIPLSEIESLRRTKDEIDVYQIAESAVAVNRLGYVLSGIDWYLPWLARLRFGPHVDGADLEELLDRCRQYVDKTADERRLLFTDLLAGVHPQATRAPLVLYRLVPTAVGIATALAFVDHQTALQLRKDQTADLPAIGDCGQCKGEVLANGERCDACGNPLWKHEWLTAT